MYSWEKLALPQQLLYFFSISPSFTVPACCFCVFLRTKEIAHYFIVSRCRLTQTEYEIFHVISLSLKTFKLHSEITLSVIFTYEQNYFRYPKVEKVPNWGQNLRFLEFTDQIHYNYQHNNKGTLYLHKPLFIFQFYHLCVTWGSAFSEGYIGTKKLSKKVILNLQKENSIFPFSFFLFLWSSDI